MNSWLSVLSAVSPPFCLLFLGGASRRLGWLSVEMDASIARLIVNLLYPCFILKNVLGAQRPIEVEEAGVAAAFGFACICIGFGVSRLVSIPLSIRKEARPAFCFCSGIFNYGFFAIPIAALFFGNDLVVKIILFNLGVEVAIWTIGILVLTSSKLNFGKVLNPPSLSVFLALFLQSFGGRAVIPEFAWIVLEMIGNCSIPIALLMIGASFYDLIKTIKPSQRLRIEIGALLTRGFLVPLIFISYAACGWIPQGMEWMAKVLVVQGAMPAGVFALIIVKTYGEDADAGMRTIMTTMLASPILLPAWLYAGMKWAIHQ